nr:hypothetical protein MarFTME_303 [Marseillevirus futianmevirus]
MERVQDVVPWPIINISSICEKRYFVAPGFTFSYVEKKNGVAVYTAEFSGEKLQYKGATNLFISDVKKFVEAEKARRELSSPVTAQLLKTIDRLEKKLEKLQKKYDALKYAPGSQKFREAKESFEQLKSEQ